MTHTVGYYFQHPQAVIFAISSVLLYPVLFTTLVALAYVVYETGRFTFELFKARKRPTAAVIAEAARAARAEFDARHVDTALEYLKGTGPAVYAQLAPLLSGPERPDRNRLLKLVTDLELQASARLERTRILVRLGPILGLMATLIPIGPALVALAGGDVQTMSNNLVIAFSATVIGLLVGGLSYMMTIVRDRMYQQEISDLEFTLDVMDAG